MNPALSRFIDCARWIAASMVLLHHAHGAFVNQGDIMTAPHAAPVYVWWFITAYPFAHGAVVVFFVLSGYLVGGALFERARDGKAYLRNYLIDRTSRIYVVLVPTILLVFLLDATGRRLFAGLHVYDQPFYDGVFNPTYILTTLVSLQGIWFPTYGTDVALWSLGMEYWYYIVFALLASPFSRAYGGALRWTGLAIGLAALVALSIPGSYFLFGACVWALGAAIRFAPGPLLRSKWIALLLWLAVVSILRLVTRGAVIEDHPRKETIDAINALLFANLLLTLRFDAGEGFAWCRARFHSVFADFSYTLYAVHMSILVFIWGISARLFGPDWRQMLATPFHYAWAIGSIVLVAVIAFLLSRVTERRTGDVRSLLRRLAPGGDPAPARAATAVKQR
ncbi:MAG: acyltransferase [Hyphomicrobiales bacterium]|nr:acyltransferase [Hyphomicrobiales bacterium]